MLHPGLEIRAAFLHPGLREKSRLSSIEVFGISDGCKYRTMPSDAYTAFWWILIGWLGRCEVGGA